MVHIAMKKRVVMYVCIESKWLVKTYRISIMKMVLELLYQIVRYKRKRALTHRGVPSTRSKVVTR